MSKTRDLAAEWQHLVAWFDAQKEVIKPAGIGRRCELTRPQMSDLISGRKTTARTVERLENLQRICAAYGYTPPTSHHLFL